MTLAWIVAATAAGGVLSVLLAATVSLGPLLRVSGWLVAFAVGVLLAAALVELIPEAAAALPAERVGLTVLAAILGFFALEKAALWRHAHAHGEAPAGPAPQAVGPLVVIGDGVHNFADGVLIAAAFLQDPALGVAAAVGVLAHEIPQEIGDFAVLLDAGYPRRQALWMNVASGSAAVAGGIVGYLALQQAERALPYALAVAAGSFLYIAVADLMPLLQRRLRPLDALLQLALILAGAAVVLAPGHG
jgi:zinc and cadmium transporter